MVELGGTADPTALVPGSVADVIALADAWKRDSDAVAASCEVLDGLRMPESWVGSAADAFGGYLSAVRKDAHHIHESLVVAVSTLREYAETLRWAQSHAAAAIGMWAEADTVAGVVRSAGMAAGANMNVTEKRAAARDMVSAARGQVASAGGAAAGRLRAASVSIPERRTGTLTTLATTSVSGSIRGPHLALLAMAASGDATQVNTWWRSLAPDDRADLIDTFPALVGNLEGADYTSRDLANRKHLRIQLAQARKELDRATEIWGGYERATRGGADRPAKRANFLQEQQQHLNALLGIEKSLVEQRGVTRQLISLTADRPPLAAVSIGNMDTASNITYVVPGMNETTANGGMTGWTAVSTNVWHAQQRAMPAGSRNAVVAWVGYDTPKDFPAVRSLDQARDGGARLDRALLGTDAVNSGARKSVIGFSYGGSTAAEALSRGSAHVDTVAMVATPGIEHEVTSPRELHADHTYVGENDGTWGWGMRTSNEWRTDVHAEQFGAEQLGTRGDGALRAVTDHAAHTAQNTGYFDPGTQSLKNLAEATTGNHDRVTGDK